MIKYKFKLKFLKMLRYKDDGLSAISCLHPNIQEPTKIQIDAFIKYLSLKKTKCDVREANMKSN